MLNLTTGEQIRTQREVLKWVILLLFLGALAVFAVYVFSNLISDSSNDGDGVSNPPAGVPPGNDEAAQGIEDEVDAGDGATEQADEVPERAVAVVDFDFDPASISVSVGETVTWTNAGSAPHTVTSDEEGLWDSGALDPGQTFAFTFTDPGTFAYHCNIHATMVGQVVVE